MHRLSHLKPAAHHTFCILLYCASTAANTSKYANPASNPAGKKASSATEHFLCPSTKNLFRQMLNDLSKHNCK